jgi:hypothetical protein
MIQYLATLKDLADKEDTGSIVQKIKIEKQYIKIKSRYFYVIEGDGASSN